MSGGIHDQHPFATPPEERDPVRRFRGRMVAPVTVITSGPPQARVGMTVSSIMVAEGLPARVYFLVGATTDLFHALTETDRFIVHLLETGHRQLSDRFAGVRPSPGGMFSDLSVTDGEYGPAIDVLPNRLYCRYAGGDESSTYHVLAAGVIDDVAVRDVPDPLVYFRGRYRHLD